MIASYKNKMRAFTLIEVIVAVFVITILTGAVVAFSRGVLRNSSLLSISLTSQSEIRKTFKNFSSEVRSSAPGFDGSYPIEVASSTTFTFYSNIDSDKYTEKIRYYIEGGTLKKGITKFNISTGRYDTAEKTSFEIKNLDTTSSTSTFYYYDKNYDGTSGYLPLPYPIDRSNIRLVKFNIISSRYGKYIKTGDVNTIQVSLRNLKDSN